MPYRVVKQLKPAPTSSVDRNGNSMNDPAWASRNIWVAKLSGSNDQTWQYSNESDAITKMNEFVSLNANEIFL